MVLNSNRPAPAAAPPGSCGQCEDIIVIKPPGEDNQSDLKWPGAPTNQIRNMRRREVVMRDAERFPSPAFIEFVDNPFLVTDGGDAWADKRQGDQCEVKQLLYGNFPFFNVKTVSQIFSWINTS